MPSSAQSSAGGQWSTVQTLPYRPIFSQLLPNGNVFFYSYYGEALSPQIWNPVTDSVIPAAPVGYSIFCSGNSFLADGRLFVAGGHEADYVGYPQASIYNPYTDSWTSAPNMNAGRWYPTATTLADGDVLVLSGDINSNTNVDPLPQVYQAGTNTWRDLTSAQLNLALYPRVMLAPNGKVFTAGPETTTRYLDTSGTGAWSGVGSTVFGSERDYGSAVMYDVGKVLIVGGGDPPTNTAETIDLNSATPAWRSSGSMHYPRRQLNATVLPDGKVLVTGGSSGLGFDNSNAPVYPAEMWDPATGAFTVVASNTVYRGYHSTAILLADGRVLAGGGNVGGANYEVYSPPYLFMGARPTITSAPSGIGYGQSFPVATPDAATIAQVSLIRLGAVTHSFDMSQRFMRLSFTSVDGGLNVTAPGDANIAPPGYYMLFLVSLAGVPSVASILQISNASTGMTGAISGNVTDGSGNPLAGAAVIYNGGIAQTDAQGHYTLANLAAGAVQLTAQLTGYQSQTQTITVTSGQTTTAPAFQLAAVQTGVITGLVENSNGSPLAGVIVAYSGGSTMTNSGGSYTLTNVPVGQVTVTASLTGFQSVTQTVSVNVNTITTAQTFTLSTAPTGSIIGKIINGSGSGIAGATVAYGAGSTTTDAAGGYTLLNVPVGTVLVGASAAGYQGETQNVAVTAGLTATANFTLVVAEGGTGTVTGMVTDINSGQLLSGATVKYAGGSTLTNSAGVYTFTNVPVGSYNMTASTNGYLARSAVATVTAGNAIQLNLQLSTAGQIAGAVTSSSGTAVAGASIQIQGGSIPTTVTVLTNSSGNYLSGWVAIGNYMVTVTAPGLATQTTTVTVLTGVTSHLNFTLVTTTTTGAITGTVTDTSGAPIAGSTVSYGSGTTMTGSTGSYQFSAVPTGTYNLTAQANGFTSSTQPVTITSGQTSTINFMLATSAGGGGGGPGTLSGTVLDISNNKPIAGATVSFSGGTTTTSATGAYQFNNVVAGSYSVTAKASGYFSATQAAPVNSGSTTTLTFSLATGGILAGTIRSSSGTAIPGASVTVSGGKVATVKTVTTGSTGGYNTYWLPVGAYTITASATGFATQSVSATVNTGQTTTVSFTLSTGSSVGTGTLSGAVVDASTSSPIVGASVSFSGGTTTTSSSGAYQFTGVTTGTYSVTAQAVGYGAAAQPATVTSGQTTTLNFALTSNSAGGGTGTLQGTVVDISTNHAISGATVSFSGGSVTTGSTGAYQFNNVPAGTYSVTAKANGYFASTNSAAVSSAGTTTLNFTLATGGILAGKVTNSSGAVVGGATVTATGGKIATTIKVTTSSTGAYNTSWLPVGTYSISVSETGHTTQSKSATVNTGQTTTINFINF